MKEVNLEYKKLMIELQLVEVEEEIIKTFVEKHQVSFNEEIKRRNPEFHKTKVNSIPKKEEEDEVNEIFPIDNTDPKIKKIYKEISKNCHPDKTSNSDYNEIFVKAKKAYEDGDLLSLLRYSNEVNLNLEIENLDIEILKINLQQRKSNLIKLESTFLWMWIHTQTEEEKLNLIDLFIKQNSTQRNP